MQVAAVKRGNQPALHLCLVKSSLFSPLTPAHYPLLGYLTTSKPTTSKNKAPIKTLGSSRRQEYEIKEQPILNLGLGVPLFPFSELEAQSIVSVFFSHYSKSQRAITSTAPPAINRPLRLPTEFVIDNITALESEYREDCP